MSGFGLLVHVLGNVIIEIVINMASPSLIAFAYGTFFMGLYIASITQILSFAIPEEKKSHSSTSDSQNDANTTKSGSSGKEIDQSNDNEDTTAEIELQQQSTDQVKDVQKTSSETEVDV